MRKIKLLYYFSFISYLLFCYYLSINENNTLLLDKEEDKNLYIAQLLVENEDINLLTADSEVFNDNYSKSLLHQRIIADTTLRSIAFEDGNYFLKAVASSNSDSRILLKLKFDKSYLADLKKLLYKECLITMDCFKIEKVAFHKEIKDIDEKVVWSSLHYDVILEGELVDLAYFRENT